MADELTARFRRWFEYERDAHAKIFASLDTVPADRRDGPDYRKAVGLLGHIVAAREVWLWRLGILSNPPGPLFLDDEPVDLGRIVATWQGLEAEWANYLAGLTDADLARVFEYRSFDGGRFTNTVEEILTTLFGHSSYHRGQIATRIRAAGGTPAATDFVYWCRQPVG